MVLATVIAWALEALTRIVAVIALVGLMLVAGLIARRKD